MDIMKKLVSLVLTLGLAVSLFAGCGDSTRNTDTTKVGADVSTEASDTAGTGDKVYRTLDEIKKSGKITIGVFSDKNPFGYVDENGDYQGYDVYFADRLAKDLGVEVEYVSTEPASRVDERAESVDFALPYMKVALGVVSPDSALVTKPEDLNGKTLIVAKGTTAETYFTENYPDVKLLKFDQYADAYNALLDGRGDALSTDNTEVLAWALQNEGYSVGIESLGNLDTIAPAVSKGNDTLREWINQEIETLAGEQFFHEDYKETLEPVYGSEVDIDSLVVEGGKVE